MQHIVILFYPYKLKHLYKEVDRDSVKGNDPELMHFSGHKIPYAVLKNELEVTDNPQKPGSTLEGYIVKLFDIQSRK